MELRQQRERNADLAVEADRARIAGDLEGICTGRCPTSPLPQSRAGNRSATVPTMPADAFVAIQGTGRETLTHMRQVVGSLRAEAPTGPQPVLAQLDRLLGESDRVDVRLQVRGDPRLLPPGLELAGYRIVEHLLSTLEKDPTAAGSVEVVFGTDALEFRVAGPSVRESIARPALAAAPSGPSSAAGPCAPRCTTGCARPRSSFR